jgi:hypothetical protein
VATLEELVIKIEAQNAELLKGLTEAQKQTASTMSNMQDAVDKFSKDASKNMGRFDQIMNVFAGTTLASVVAKGAQIAQQAISAFIGNFKTGIDEAAQFEKEMVRLGNSLAMSGNFSKEAARDLEEYIGSMETLSGIDDAVIAGNLAMLSSLTRLDAEGLKKAQSAAIDLSAALGKDLGTVTDALAKASNGNTTALQKMGLQFEKTGDNARDFETALTMIESRFGGAAGGAMKTFSGSLLGVQNAFGNLFQQLGSIVTQNPVVVATLNEISKIFAELTTAADKAGPGLKEAFAQALIGVINFAEVTVQSFDVVMRTINFIIDGFVALGIGIIDTWNAAKSVLSGEGLPDDPFGNFKASWDEATANFGEETMLNTLAENLNRVGNVAEEAFTKADFAAKGYGSTIENQVAQVEQLSLVEKMRAEQAATFGQQIFDQSVQVAAGYQLQQDTLQTAYESDLISFESYKEAKLASQMAMFEQERLMLEESKLNEEQLAMAKTQLDQQQNAQRFKLMQDMQKKEADINKQRLEGFSGFFGNLGALQQTKSKELFAIGKAASLAQATIDGYAAMTSSYKQGAAIGGPALGAAFAAAAGAATAVQISKIAATNLRSGIDSVPGVGTQDNFPAMLAPGERVVPSQTNQDLTEFLRNQQSSDKSGPVFNLNFYGPVWSDKAQAGAEIVDAINEAMDRGFSLKLRNA